METLFDTMKKVKGFVFDMDGVLGWTKVDVTIKKNVIRKVNVKDGFALSTCIDRGFKVAIISAGTSYEMKKQLKRFGINNVYLNCKNKFQILSQLCNDNDFALEHIAYMGDDILDMECLRHVALPCCPNDAISEVKQVCDYISYHKGGEGCVREIVERTLKTQQKWY